MKNSGILDTIFICIILNIIPVAALGLFKISSNVYAILYAVSYCIQSILLFFRLFKNMKHISKRNFFVLFLFLFNNVFALLYSSIMFGNIDYNEYLFIISSTLNVLFYIVSIEKISISNEELVSFLKKMCLVGLISVLINIILNFHSILNLNSLRNSYSASFSSFFPNRNQFGLFMLIEIICLALLSSNKFQKKYIIYFTLFFINLLLTMSRNSILGLIVFMLMFMYYKYLKHREMITKNKYLIYMLSFLVLVSIIIVIMGDGGKINAFNTLFVRFDTLETGSGRFSVWQNGLYIGTNYNFLFGVGRYKALELNNLLFNNNLEYFHSLYIERFASLGIIGLLILLYLLKYVWKKTNDYLNTSYKAIMKASLISFYVFSLFETTTRFSIGYADTIFLIFFFTLPILMSTIKDEKT